jgi:hypothetical protein
MLWALFDQVKWQAARETYRCGLCMPQRRNAR